MTQNAYSPPPARPVSVQLVRSADGVECVLYDLAPERSDEAPQLFLSHATGFPGRVYLPLAVRLTDYHCFTADLRGHGRATSPEGHRYDWQGFTEDLDRIFRALPPSPARFGVGHSMGAALLLRLEQAKPGTFRALYCFEPIVPTASFEALAAKESPLVSIARKRRSVFADREEAYANYASKPPLSDLHPDCLSAYVEWGFHDLPDRSIELELPGPEEAEVFAMSGSHDTFAALSEVRCPVAVAHGAIESRGASAWVGEIVSALPAGTQIAFPDLGHFGPLQDIDRIAESIAGFFAAAR